MLFLFHPRGKEPKKKKRAKQKERCPYDDWIRCAYPHANKLRFELRTFINLTVTRDENMALDGNSLTTKHVCMHHGAQKVFN